MGLEDADNSGSSISCSICLEDVKDFGDRAFAMLRCGHQFHLDCIGSAFNVKGVMQCPNCRKVEKGQWLYADGGRRSYPPELNFDDLVNDEGVYELSFSEASMWCPFGGGFTRLAAAFDEVEFPTVGFNEVVEQHGVFSEHAPVSSGTHICPYIAYVPPLHPSTSSTSSGNVADGARYNIHWNSHLTPSEITSNSYGLPPMDTHYHTHADHPSVPSIMPRRPPRTNVDMPRSGSYVHPFPAGQSSSSRGSSSVSSSTVHPYPGSAARAWERSQALEAYFQQPSNLPAPGSHRSNGQVQVGSSSDQTRGGGAYYPSTARSFQEAEGSNMLNQWWERDPHPYPNGAERGPFHQAGGGSAGGFRQRHGSEGAPSQSQYWP